MGWGYFYHNKRPLLMNKINKMNPGFKIKPSHDPLLSRHAKSQIPSHETCPGRPPVLSDHPTTTFDRTLLSVEFFHDRGNNTGTLI